MSDPSSKLQSKTERKLKKILGFKDGSRASLYWRTWNGSENVYKVI